MPDSTTIDPDDLEERADPPAPDDLKDPDRAPPPMSADTFAGAALARMGTSGKQYLGDPDAVEDLWRVAIASFIDRWMEVADDEALVPRANQADLDECKRLAGILLGRSPDWIPVEDFNAEILPNQVRNYVGWDETQETEELMQAWVAKLFNSLHDDMQNHGSGKINLDDCKRNIDNLVHEYTMISTGQSPYTEES